MEDDSVGFLCVANMISLYVIQYTKLSWSETGGKCIMYAFLSSQKKKIGYNFNNTLKAPLRGHSSFCQCLYINYFVNDSS